MVNEEHLRILKQGASIWNQWREENPGIRPDLHGADLRGRTSKKQDLRLIDLGHIQLSELSDLRLSELVETNIIVTDLRWANLKEADLSEANLDWSDLRGTNLDDANLANAHLDHAHLIDTRLNRTVLTGCSVFGISAWDLRGEPFDQSSLRITRIGDTNITVDNLEVAQFIYLLLHNHKIRDIIDTITSKVVLILGRFGERKPVLDAIKEELRKRDYLPILFDFEGPKSRDLTETVSTLAHMARFIIADITDAKSIPAELQCIVPQLPSVPVQPLILSSDYEFALFEHIIRFPSVLELYR